ncbi:nicotinate-nucleotide--dimethylbenzimidazole phosphoribosyltransferase [Fretibacterium fastidiosum]|uniref:Nicotinate-nucleotide--dimethylbenzimidazole phosphoribosyltransferase n=1 Tax=Fretibacterium fastidiosum TaxID=651822 RepID=A0AB94IZ68_9BACT|nr:nicotinate-nucleotide--dimethylbenzimidazole phosphoribosyltransferase [Fretibacterium fastidiosum]CBL29020.1 nicotinate-nucleotide--dimethylbenzimidazole phosphoribosyltransferase [Fretibacterium fastidiosum]
MQEHLTIEQAVARIAPLDAAAVRAAEERQKGLLKPVGSLGELEALSIRLAGITGKVKNSIDRRVHLLFGSDHGVYDEGVSGSPQYFTRVLMEFYAADVGCGINVLCRRAGVDLRLFDLGVRDLGPTPRVDASCKLMPRGTENFARGRAMTPETARRAVEFGIECAGRAREEGYQILGAGEVGMGNTTPAAACIMAALDSRDSALVGRGGGLTDAAFETKKRVILGALDRHRPDPQDALDILSCVGGLDLAAMTGVFLGSAAYRVPAVVDGVIAIAAALLASRIAPLSREFLIASHRSVEPAYAAVAEAMGLHPLVTLGMRLGEGTGCPIAMQIVDDALTVMNEMGTFAEVSLESEYREVLKQ